MGQAGTGCQDGERSGDGSGERHPSYVANLNMVQLTWDTTDAPGMVSIDSRTGPIPGFSRTFRDAASYYEKSTDVQTCHVVPSGAPALSLPSLLPESESLALQDVRIAGEAVTLVVEAIGDIR